MPITQIKRFAQPAEDGKHQIFWYDIKDGHRICCDEDIIMRLWCDWVQNKNNNSQRADDGKFNVFEYKEPIFVDLEKMEDWTKC